jgi:iron complex transport system substrate-binding protein
MLKPKSKKIIAMIIVIIVAGGSIGAVGYLLVKEKQNKGVIIDTSSDVTGVKLDRIVSLDPAATATLYAMGAYKYVVGSNCYATYPPNNLPNVTDYPTMSVQQILNLTPDAVISFTNYSSSQINELLNAGIDYVFLSAGANSSFKDIESQNILLGKLTGTEHNATLLNNWMNKSLGVFSNLTLENKTILYAMCVCDHGTETSGSGTFVDQIFKYSHLENIANDSGFYQISNEIVVNSNPQVILLGQCFNKSDLNQAPYTDTAANKTGSIYTVFSTNLFSEPNFRNIYAIDWLIYQVYHVKANIPSFPFNLTYNPEPTQVQNI